MHYVSLILAVVAAILLFSPDTILDKNSKNTQLKMVYDNAMYIGVGCAGLAYYYYAHGANANPKFDATSEILPSAPEVSTQASSAASASA